MSIDRLKATLTSFTAYFVMSAIISPLGILSNYIAEAYSVPITSATAAFSALTSGVLAGTFIAVLLYEFFKLKNIVLTCSFTILAAFLALYLSTSFASLLTCFFVIGACCGVKLSAGAVVITMTYEEKIRAAMLLLTDSFYSSAGFVSTSLALTLIAFFNHWTAAYLLAATTLVITVIAALSANYPQTRSTNKRDNNGNDVIRESYPKSVYVAGLALFVYLIGFVSVYSWLPNYAQTALGIEEQSASRLVSNLFTGMFFGQLAMFLLVFRLPMAWLVSLSICGSTVLTCLLWTITDISHLKIVVTALGFVGGGFLKTCITKATLFVPQPSARMVGLLMLCPGIGTAVAPALSAAVVELGGMMSALQFASGCYLLTGLLFILALKLNKIGPQHTTTLLSKKSAEAG